MPYVDLHIHSRFSRATSSALNPSSLSLWAGYKGLSLIGTGDLTHPGWLRELAENLTLRDDGFYSLNDQPHGTRFVPTGEVSAIYKQDGRTRKIHLVVIAPDLEAAGNFSKTLGALGNVESDGRPILGMPARQILEIALHTHPDMVVVPAHIWTPWFSLFGAKSGFDHLEECFGDLSPHITALETGLSSDPGMNRLISALDRYALVSSSDAHSPEKLGREATILTGPLTRANLWSALAGGPGLGGTVEFFPEEGKYHLDGHLGCGPPLTPEETKALAGRCPVCGRPLTIGVLHRVTELADRSEPLADRLPDHHLIPLPEILGQVFGQGAQSKRVAQAFERLVGDFGSEFKLLLETPLDQIEDAAGPLLRLAVDRMRRGEIEAHGGFDGQFGTVLAIRSEERAELSGQGRLFEAGASARSKKSVLPPPAAPAAPAPDLAPMEEAGPPAPPLLSLVQGDLLLDGLDEAQRLAVTSRAPVLAVQAGPGSGKTRVLVHRAAWLLREGLVRPEEMILTTYTKKAAQELGPRLTAALPFRPESRKVRVATLHALAYEILKSQKPDWDLAPEDWLEDLRKKAAKKAGLRAPALAALLSLAKSAPEAAAPPAGAPADFPAAFQYYQRTLAANRWWDFDDLILEADPAPPAAGASSGQGGLFDSAPEPSPAPAFPRPRALLVDEFQDLSAAQYSFIQRLQLPGDAAEAAFLTVIGDPDQSIYHFRGARADLFEQVARRPGVAGVALGANYRSTKTIVQAGESLLARPDRPRRQTARPDAGPRLTRATLANPKREATYVVARLCAHLGILKLGLEGGGRQDVEAMPGLGLSDIAVLFRLRSLGAEVAAALDEAGLAWQMCGPDPLTAVDGLDWTADKINLLTMHAAKGLEFKLVFVIGAEEGLCPYLAPGEAADPARLEEEKRLFYVALTRAKDRLYLTRGLERRLYGQRLPGAPSPFWDCLAPGLCQDITPQWRRPRTKPAPTLFD